MSNERMQLSQKKGQKWPLDLDSPLWFSTLLQLNDQMIFQQKEISTWSIISSRCGGWWTKWYISNWWLLVLAMDWYGLTTTLASFFFIMIFFQGEIISGKRHAYVQEIGGRGRGGERSNGMLPVQGNIFQQPSNWMLTSSPLTPPLPPPPSDRGLRHR